MREFTSSIIDLSPLEAFADQVYYMRLDCLQPVYHAPCNLAGYHEDYRPAVLRRANE